MNKIDPNDAISALIGQYGYRVIAEQPPDGATLQLADGTLWNVTAYRNRSQDQDEDSLGA